MGDVKAVPAGKYAKAALEKLGAWAGVEEQARPGRERARGALALVAHGEAPLGIVYKTDAASDPSVKIVGTFPADSHPPIIYPAALTRDGEERRRRRPSSSSWAAPSAKAAFEKQGFSLIGPVAS